MKWSIAWIGGDIIATRAFCFHGCLRITFDDNLLNLMSKCPWNFFLQKCNTNNISKASFECWCPLVYLERHPMKYIKNHTFFFGFERTFILKHIFGASPSECRLIPFRDFYMQTWHISNLDDALLSAVNLAFSCII